MSIGQLMVNWWFGLVVWIPEIPNLWAGLLLRDTPIRIPNHPGPKPKIYHYLGGNFTHFLFSPLTLRKMNPIWRAYFSKGFVQPPTRLAEIAEGWDFPKQNLPTTAALASAEAGEGFRLEGFDGQPATLTSMDWVGIQRWSLKKGAKWKRFFFPFSSKGK